MKQLRRSFALLMSLVVLAVAALPVAATSEQVQQARNGVARVFCLEEVQPAGNRTRYKYSTGSAFAVGEAGKEVSYFVTNHHVINGNPEQVYLILDRFNGLNTLQEDGIKAQVVWDSESPDLALLRVEEPISERSPLPLLSTQSVQVTQPVFALGFPGVSDDMNDEGKKLPSTPADVTVTTGTVTKEKQDFKGMSCLQIDAVINHGNSGGPLITDSGAVVGVNTFGAINDDKTQADGMNYAIYIDYIMQVLDKNNVPYEKAAAGAQTPQPAASGGGTPASAPAGVAPGSAQGHGEGNRTGVTIALVGVGAVALIGLVYYLKNKQRRAPASESAPPAPARTAPVKEPVAPVPTAPVQTLAVRCTGGPLSGMQARVSGSVLVGRDPARCSLVFPRGTPGVSAVHCELRGSDAGLELLDRGSTYGTFLADGTRLTPHQPYPLRQGARFYLGMPDNGFQVL